MKIVATFHADSGRVLSSRTCTTQFPLDILSILLEARPTGTVRLNFDIALDPVTTDSPEAPETVTEGPEPAYPPAYLPDPPAFGMLGIEGPYTATSD